MPKGSFGKVGLANSPAGTDFLVNAHVDAAAAGDIPVDNSVTDLDGVSHIGVNQGTITYATDEPGGVVLLTSDTADDDNVAIFLGRFRPADGGVWMETRFKFDSLNVGIFVGFTETLLLTEPVMPAEFATSSMTYNGTGGMIGLQMDLDGTDDDFRALGGDGGAATGDAAANGTRANETLTVDEFYIARVEIDNDGTGRCYIGHDGGLAGDVALVAEFNTAVITPGDDFYAILMMENRTGANNILEVDYFYAQGGRDWAV